jgi:hypothetical protein
MTDRTTDDRLEDFREWVESWAEAYPLDIFPEPDMKKAHEVLTAAGMSLDRVSASAMRYVITRVRDKMRATLDVAGEPK